MTNSNETVREVCADISYLTGDLADRILAAHEREMAAKAVRESEVNHAND